MLEQVLGEHPAVALTDSPLLGWDDLRAVRSAGVEIGGHTVDHACLHTEPPEEATCQVRSSKERLELELNAPVVDFAYPNGWYSARAVCTLRDAGYRSAVTTEDRLNRHGENPLLLKRKIAGSSPRAACGASRRRSPPATSTMRSAFWASCPS